MKKIILFTPILASLIIISHFLIVLLTVLPYNPVSQKIDNIIYSYTEPIFTQTWTLFAPDPINYNDVLQIKLEFSDGEVSDWIDTTTPIVEKMHSNYFSPYNRMGRITGSISGDMLSENEIMNNLREAYEVKEEEEKIEQLNKIHEDDYEKFSNYLLRYGSAYAISLYPKEKLKNIEMRLIRQESIPFSQRNENIEMDWNVIDTIEKQQLAKDIVPLI